MVFAAKPKHAINMHVTTVLFETVMSISLHEAPTKSVNLFLFARRAFYIVQSVGGRDLRAERPIVLLENETSKANEA
jgi:hypothetical protein